MKKTAALVCALLLVLLLPGCTLVQQVGNVAKQAEELPVAECVQAAADGDEDTFRSYLHPALSVEAVQGGYQSLHQYLNGITKDAQKRLDAIQALEDLGSGFYLAMHDLEIRGAGEVLGEHQSGEIAAVKKRNNKGTTE